MLLADDLQTRLLELTGATGIAELALIQSLWSGYGELFRVKLDGADYPSLVVKHIRFSQPDSHPRGWNTDLAFQRKRHSYQVEQHWYTDYAGECPAPARVPARLHCEENAAEMLLLLEDLHPAGYPQVVTQMDRVHWDHIAASLDWLAHLHAYFLDHPGDKLWRCGGYWHLDTRPDELAAMDDTPLKRAAPLLDQALRDCRYRTLIHGDAKIANFCFSSDAKRSAAVDFQYVGQGCGIQDVALLMSSCVPPQLCAEMQDDLLDHYFGVLIDALSLYQPQADAAAIAAAWRDLFAIAWADFQRFVTGWCPDHWKINDYSNALTTQALQQLALAGQKPARAKQDQAP